MDVFTLVEDARAILLVRGVYRQADVYTREGGRYYAKWGAGFVRLLRHNCTSVPSIRWIEGEGFNA